MESIDQHTNLRVLWFTLTPSLYEVGGHHYHGCGWIESLEALIAKESSIDLAVSFFHKNDSQKVEKEQTTYYPILRKSVRSNPVKAVINNWRGLETIPDYDAQFKTIIADFNPDVIHVFGTESTFGNLPELTDVPVVIHLQGILNPIVNAYFPPGHSPADFRQSKFHFRENLIGSSAGFTIKKYENRAAREQHIFAKAEHVMGRTHWDKMMVSLFNSGINYHHVDEVLRPPFYKVTSDTNTSDSGIFEIVSTLSPTVYKGIDVILKTARELKKLINLDVNWTIVGLDADDPMLKHFEHKIGVHHKAISIQCVGRKNPEELISLLTRADFYVHPTYIDNSPNSVCEAQIVGTPVIACDVGGVSSLISHNETGLLVPANGVFELVHYINMLANDNHLSSQLGSKAKAIALQRHNPTAVVGQVLEVYKKMNAGV